ncbi:hypothetical protein AAVH_19719 [Aphelenchoides avenae]|nr:hypothetical protein AAVH_19719 [Aphelenchus avenae]
MMKYGVLQDPYYMEGPVLGPCYFFTVGFCCFFQCVSHCVIAVNRYTVIMHPTKHDMIWSGTSFHIIMFTMFFVPALAAGERLAMVIKVVTVGEGHGVINVIPWANLVSDRVWNREIDP